MNDTDTQNTLIRRSRRIYFSEFNCKIEYSVNMTRENKLRVACVAVDDYPPELPTAKSNTQLWTISVTASRIDDATEKPVHFEETCLQIHNEKRFSQPILFAKTFTSINETFLKYCSKITVTIEPTWKPLSHNPVTIDYFPLTEKL